NSQIFSNSGGYMGVSFAIPSDLAVSVVNQLKSTGRVARGQLGVQVQAIQPSMAQSLGLPNAAGALVNGVMDGSAAARAGLRVRDVIRAVNGRQVNDSSDLPPLIGALAPKSRVELTVVRDGKTLQVPVVLDELSVAATGEDGGTGPSVAPPASPSSNSSLGVAVQDLSAAERQRLGLGNGEGVRIASVEGTSAREAGLRPGDVILQVGRSAVGSAGDLSRAVSAVPRGQAIMLLVRRGNSTQFVAVEPAAG
ncbi:MAG TPA: PDZ domain-containing protein, partial [Lysobacter sp.]